MKLQDTGIIKFNANCQITQPEMIISSEPQKFVKGNYKFDHDVPNLNLSTMMNEHTKLATNFTIDHSRQLQIIHEQLNKIHEQTFVEKVQHYAHFSLHGTMWIVAIISFTLIWMKRHEIRKLCKFMSTYMMTSSGNLVDVSWRNWRSTQQVNQGNIGKDNRSQPVVCLFNTRGQDVQSGHFETI